MVVSSSLSNAAVAGPHSQIAGILNIRSIEQWTPFFGTRYETQLDKIGSP
jgi:hypothetical protein